MINTTTTDALTLTDIAARLDQHRQAIAACRETIDEAQQQIAEHEQEARDLIAAQERLTRQSFAGLYEEEIAAAAAPRRRRQASSNGASNGNVDYTARIATRNRNKAIRAFAAEHELAVPESGNDFSPELLDAFNREAGYQG